MTDDEDSASDEDRGRDRRDSGSDRPAGSAGHRHGPDADVDESATADDGRDSPDTANDDRDTTDIADEERGVPATPREDITASESGPDEEVDAADDETAGLEDDPGSPATDAAPGVPDPESVREGADGDVPEDVRKYDRFKKVDGSQYERVNDFLRERTYITAREWAIARLCADFRTETGVEMTKIGENLPELVPFMTDTYTPQAVNQARASFEEKVRKAGATFLYGAMSDFFTAEELDDVMYEATEVAKFLLEVEGVDLDVEEELAAEDRISSVMREVRAASDELRHDTTTCPECGHEVELD